MEKITLLINGEDLDTGIYEYSPYVDKKLNEFKTTFRIMTRLKTKKLDENSDEAKEYIYARYAVGKEDTNRNAITAAYNAGKEFRKTSLLDRKKILLDMHDLLLEKKEEFIKLLILEGHPRMLAEWEFDGMEIGSSPETIDFYCKQIHQQNIGRYGNEELSLIRKPDGVVCISPPGNAAASNSYNAILTFLVGNTLIVKPPLRDPISTIFLWKEVVNKALVKNNVPAGVLNIVLGNSRIMMDEWLSSDQVNDIIYFSDSKKGLELGSKIYLAGKKPILELSGNDMLIVWKDADLDKASDSLLDCFLGSTQICMVPKIGVIHQDVYEDFTEIFLNKVKKLKIGLPSDPETMMSPVAKIQDYFEFLQDALDNGGKLIHGGQRVDHYGNDNESGVFVRPALVKVEDSEKALGMKCLREEIFFPFLPLIKVSGDDESVFNKMINMVNNHAYGLRSSLWISSEEYLGKFEMQLDNCGIFRINSRHVGFSHYISTHGGMKKSGGPFGEMNYFWQKTSHLQGISKTPAEKINQTVV